MKIATLGPKGTFSHEAVLDYDGKAEIVFKSTIWEVFDSVKKGDVKMGIVPIENSVGGTIGTTIDALMNFNLKIMGEKNFAISHNLVGNGNKKEINKLYIHPQTYEQCEKYIRKNLPKAEIILTSSNGRSAQIVSKKNDKTTAAIAPKIAARTYKLKILERGIQDNKFNVTKFVIISKTESNKNIGKIKTSIAMKPTADRPGLLHELLGVFAKRRINLTKIESRPAKGKLGDYIFYIDLLGHKNDKKVKSALSELKKNVNLRIFGSYPVSKK